ncbi:MAG TPA: cytochrome c [Gemmatimonadaceae bacterium]|nr:cytochrome c [Gemmatimonadaceae bacterium]
MPSSRPGSIPLVPLLGIATLTIAGVVLASPNGPLGAHRADPTFAKDVAPIVYHNCAMCHRPGGQGPFSLLDYDSAADHVDEIRDAVKTGAMPPWHAEGPHGVFRNDRRLSDADKQTILDWIDAGAKAGDAKDLPPKPVYPTSWSIGTPDAIVEMPESFHVPASGTIEYQYFQVPTGFTEDKWIQAMEFMPGARQVVHHILVYAYTPPQPGAQQQSAPTAPPPGTPRPQPLFLRNPAYRQQPEPPRQDTLHAPPRQLGTLIGGTAPGTNVMEFAKGTALKIRAGTVLTFQMHYTAKGHDMMDRSKVGFKFAAEPPNEEISMAAFTNGSFTIPAGGKDSVPSEITATQPVRIWGLLPHTHLRGVKWRYTLEKPDGTSEVVLDVPHYDFNWQTYYLFDKPLEIPAGAKLKSMAWYDNSVANKHNPDPTKDVHWGDQTWEEMQYTGFLYSVPSRNLKKSGTTQH